VPSDGCHPVTVAEKLRLRISDLSTSAITERNCHAPRRQLADASCFAPGRSGPASLAAILSGIATSVYFYTIAQPYPSRQLIVLNGVLTAAAGIAAAIVPLLRVTHQKSISGDPDADQ
jgi:hypothetical protein